MGDLNTCRYHEKWNERKGTMDQKYGMCGMIGVEAVGVGVCDVIWDEKPAPSSIKRQCAVVQ
jgi:hypothetical protein